MVGLITVAGSHTSDNIASCIETMLDNWNLRETHVIVRDNAANISKALETADVANIGCFAHTIQLCVNKPLESKEQNLQFLSHLLAQCRAIVGHFSVLAFSACERAPTRDTGRHDEPPLTKTAARRSNEVELHVLHGGQASGAGEGGG